MQMKSVLTLLVASTVALTASPLDTYKITWSTPSVDALDSMPLSGRHGAGANVWVQDGSIWLYLAHNGAYDEQGRLLKLGCVRLTPDGVKLGEAGFLQELDPSTGTIIIRQGEFKASLWFADQTLVFESSNKQAEALEVAFGSWRAKPLQNITEEMNGNRGNYAADRIQAGRDGFLWFHRNADTPEDLNAKATAQGIDPLVVPDATSRRVFGGAIAMAGGLSQPVESDVRWQFWNGKAWTGRTQAAKEHVITMRLDGALNANPKQWQDDAKSLFDERTRQAAKNSELKRWDEFWSRSHIHINPEAGEADSGFLIGRNYQLFRYMTACNRDGELPLLFNGGIFTTDNNGRIKGNNNSELPIFADHSVTPDYRRWMTCHFMSQNQRWLGWPALANGDPDLFSPTLEFYRDRSKVAASRAKHHGADGVVYPEPLDVWGLCCVGPRADGLTAVPHLTYHFSMMLEHAWMALQAHDALGISIEKDLPWIQGTVFFYDSFYRAQTKQRTGKEWGDDGKLLIYPANGLELVLGATNPIEVVCGLKRITAGLLALPNLSRDARARLQKIQPTLPDMPIGKRQGVPLLLPARSWESEYNKWEPIEMYAAWPYRLVGITRPDRLQLARDTWDSIPEDRARLCKQDYSWMPNVANMAALASPEKAKERAIYKMANNTAPQSRFPAFFGPGHDWLPDFNWGGSGMTGIQEMLLAPEPGVNGKLNLFPAWPAEWDVDFKLHAPGQTLVEASLKGGKLVSLKVTPASREKDIVNWLGKQPEWKPFTPRPSLGQGKPISASSQFIEPGFDAKLANDGDPKTRWASDFGARSGWLEIDLGEEKEIGSVYVSEIEWPETRKFTIEVKQNGTWKEVARGTTIGRDREIPIQPVKATHLRFSVLESSNAININELQVFPHEPDGI